MLIAHLGVEAMSTWCYECGNVVQNKGRGRERKQERRERARRIGQDLVHSGSTEQSPTAEGARKRVKGE